MRDFMRSNASALINGKTVFRGDAIAGGRVVAIEPQSRRTDASGNKKILPSEIILQNLSATSARTRALAS